MGLHRRDWIELSVCSGNPRFNRAKPFRTRMSPILRIDFIFKKQEHSNSLDSPVRRFVLS
jgi:hypothetical protein